MAGLYVPVESCKESAVDNVMAGEPTFTVHSLPYGKEKEA